MKIPQNKLASSLGEKLEDIYLLLAKESVQIEESLEKIYIKSKSNNFTEKESHVVSSQTRWQFLFSKENNFDLFGAKKVIEIKLIGQGPGVKGAKALKEYSKKPNPNILLVVTGEDLDRKSYSSAWVKALEKAGAFISIEPLSPNSLSIWIQKKGEKCEINILSDARKLLAEKTEGNLMATLQEITKLSLIYPSQDIDLNKMEKNIANSSRFNIFDFSNAFVTRDTKKAVRILEALKVEGTPETLIIWALARELKNLFKVIQTGSAKGIFGPRHYLETLEKSAKKVSKIRVLKAFKEIALIDASIKGFVKQNPWLGIRELTLTF
mgnify:CR=1 FL=1